MKLAKIAVFTDNTKIFIHYKYPPESGELPPEDHHAFAVEKVAKMSKPLVEQGLRLQIPPQDFSRGRSASLRDPDGCPIEIVQIQR